MGCTHSKKHNCVQPIVDLPHDSGKGGKWSTNAEPKRRQSQEAIHQLQLPPISFHGASAKIKSAMFQRSGSSATLSRAESYQSRPSSANKKRESTPHISSAFSDSKMPSNPAMMPGHHSDGSYSPAGLRLAHSSKLLSFSLPYLCALYYR